MATIFPISASVNQEFNGYVFDGDSWNAVGAGFAIENLSDVEISSILDGDSLIYNSASSKWINQIPEGSSVTISSNPPGDPDEGDLWFDYDTQELFIYDSVYWVEVSGGALDISQYLTIASASATYATQVDLDNIDALPPQAGNNGKYLTTSGSVASWGTLDLSLYLTQSSASTTYQTKNIDVISAKTGAYTIASGDEGDLIQLSGSSSYTVSIPTDETFNFAIGTQINLINVGTGVKTIAAVTPGTTSVNGTPGLKLRAQWSSATLIKLSSNMWIVVGDLSA
jgi:hypothetical protein